MNINMENVYEMKLSTLDCLRRREYQNYLDEPRFDEFHNNLNRQFSLQA